MISSERPILYILFFILLMMNCHSIDPPDLIEVIGGEYVSESWGTGISTTLILEKFFISKYEITVGEWKDFLLNTDYEFKWEKSIEWIYLESEQFSTMDTEYPMFNINWIDAIFYCNWLSKEFGYEQVYEIQQNNGDTHVIWDTKKEGFRLPTEVEWEYAASGGINSKSYIFSGSNYINKVAWFEDNAFYGPEVVGKKAPNELNIYDMSGNVEEWCWDYFDQAYVPMTNSQLIGPKKGYIEDDELSQNYVENLRVVRGGGWTSNQKMCQLNFRSGANVNSRGAVGFRIVLDIN